MAPHATKRRRLNSSDGESSRHSDSSSDSESQTEAKQAPNNAAAKNASKAPPKRIAADTTAQLAQATGLSKSGLFKLQTDDLLAELRPDYDKLVSQVHDFLSKIKDAICGLPESQPKVPRDAELEMRKNHGIVVPFPSPAPDKDSKLPMAYQPPVNVNVVGSLSLRTGLRIEDTFNVDLAVTMPKTIFQEKDYLNHRYFYKRAYYVACLAAGIKRAKLPVTISFATQDGDGLRPVIFLEPSTGASEEVTRLKLRVRIITALEDGVFPVAKTLPIKNNIRSRPEGQSSPDEPSPFYNGSLRSEATVTAYHKLLYSTLKKYENVRDACFLGRTWLRQRGFGSSLDKGGFGAFEWAAVVALLFEGGGPNGKPILLPSYSSYQVFKATLQFLAGRDLFKPLALSARDVQFPPGAPVLYDGKRGLNILYKMTPWSYNRLRHEARKCVSMLNESRFDNFDKIFIYNVRDDVLQYDRVIYLTADQRPESTLWVRRYEEKVYQILQRAFGDRVKLINVSGREVPSWSLSSRPTFPSRFTVGLVVNGDNAARLVDHGPAVEDKEEAASFRDFWGDKAELRRFRDGSIRESLVWADEAHGESVITQIATYTLRRHLKLSEVFIRCVGDEFDGRVRRYCGPVSASSPAFSHAYDAFLALQKSLQELEELPLAVRQLQAASPVLRHTALPPRAEETVLQNPIDTVLQLESSARWPDDLVAIQMTKVAFLTKIGDLLKDNGAIASFAVGLENEDSNILNRAFLDVVHHPSRVTFRLRIHHDREQTLLERTLKDKNASPRVKEEAAAALAEYKRLFIQAPRLTQAMRSLSTRFPALSPTVRLLKHWLRAHLLVPHVREEAVELLTAHAFLSPDPWDPPASVMAGFLRTLALLSKWNWQRDPLVVDFGGEMFVQDVDNVRTRFRAWRSVDPAMRKVALMLASDIDPDGVTWTQDEMPPKVVAARISSLARAAIALIRENPVTQSQKKQHDDDHLRVIEVDPFFKSPLTDYDFILHLATPSSPSSNNASTSRFKNLDPNFVLGAAAAAGASSADKNGSELIRAFLSELQNLFGESILFFHGGAKHANLIAGLWKPQTQNPRAFGLKIAYSMRPAEDEDNEPNKKAKEASDDVVVNRTAILNEIARLGAGIVRDIEVRK
ncbi:hypothetical protein VTN49DRAFT_1554 [Thermomyces lanuginosus]|uniref:uncharacterized protein n=1 Tax=Thermomyces lanuginosus TaxID=5541 RepID=UPI0037429409